MNESDSIALPLIPLRRFLSRQPRAWRKSHGSAPMRRKFFRLWITFVLTGPRGTPSLSHESLIERPSPSETRTCTSHEKMTRRRDRRRATETDGDIRYEVSFLCLPGVDITRTVINTRNTTMITRSYRAYGMLRCTGCLIPHGRLTRSRTFLMYTERPRGVFFEASCNGSRHTRAFGWIGRYLVTCRTCRVLFLSNGTRRKGLQANHIQREDRQYSSEEAFYYILIAFD